MSNSVSKPALRVLGPEIEPKEIGWRPTFGVYMVAFSVLVCGPTLAAVIWGPQSLQYYVTLAAVMPVAILRIAQPYPSIPSSVGALIVFAVLPVLLVGAQSLNRLPGLEAPNALVAAGMSATVVAAIFGAHLNDRDFRSSMHLVALVHLGFLIFGLLQPAQVAAAEEASTRFSGGEIGVAVWAELAFAAVISAVLSRRWHIIVICAVAAAPILIGTQMRGATIASVATLAIYVSSKIPARAAFVLYLLALPAFVISQQFWGAAGGFFGDALLLSDPHRGLSSGFSGRFDNWIAGYEAFLSAPWTGSSIGDAVVRYTHNGFIMCFAELGLIGGLAFLLGLIGANLVALRKRDWACVAAITGYMLFIFTIPRYLNFSSSIIIGLAVVARMLAPEAPSARSSDGSAAAAYRQRRYGELRTRRRNDGAR